MMLLPHGMDLGTPKLLFAAIGKPKRVHTVKAFGREGGRRGLGAWAKLAAAGWLSRNFAIGFGLGAVGRLAASALRNAASPATVEVGKPLYE